MEEVEYAWLHWCGHLNKGLFEVSEPFCNGCRFEARLGEVRQFGLWPVMS